MEFLSPLSEWLTPEGRTALLRAGLLVFAGLLVAKLSGSAVGKLMGRSSNLAYTALARRAVTWTVAGLAIASAMEELGFDLSLLLGAAGIVTVAIGFASQTSASNLISGVFLLLEGAVAVGDLIRVGNTTGEVLSIDLLSVKLRTFDNLLVRVPNESLVKSEITNLTKFPIRRVDLIVGVAYKEQLGHVREVVAAVCDANPLVLRDPVVVFKITGFGDSGVNLEVSAWCVKDKFLEVRTGLYEQIKAAFDDADIEIPYPHRTLVTGNSRGPVALSVDEDTGRSS